MERVEGLGVRTLSIYVGAASTFHPPVSAECSSRPSPVLGNIPPNDGMPEAPSLRVSFRYVPGPRPCAAFTPGQGPGRRGREGEREKSVAAQLCHGLNTAKPLVQTPSLPIPLATPSKNQGGSRESWRAGTSGSCCVISAGVCFLHTSFASRHSPPLVGRRGLLPRPVQSYL